MTRPPIQSPASPAHLLVPCLPPVVQLRGGTIRGCHDSSMLVQGSVLLNMFSLCWKISATSPCPSCPTDGTPPFLQCSEPPHPCLPGTTTPPQGRAKLSVLSLPVPCILFCPGGPYHSVWLYLFAWLSLSSTVNDLRAW